MSHLSYLTFVFLLATLLCIIVATKNTEKQYPSKVLNVTRNLQ